MRRPQTIGAVLAAVTFASVLAGAAAQRGTENRPAPPGAPGVRTPSSQAATPGTAKDFDAGMERAGRALKALRRSALDAATRSTDLATIQSLQSGLLASKGAASAIPMSPNAKKKFGDDQTAYETAFRQDLLQALQQSLVIEAALLEGSTDNSKAALAKLVEMQKAGHSLFQDE